MNHRGKLGTLIVTGGSRGIGAAVATLASERGYFVAVNFSTGEAEAKKVVDAIAAGGGHAIAVQADVSDEQQIMRMFQTAEQQLGPIKALVNNAGVTGGFARVEEVTSAALAKVFAVNVAGTILCSREAVRRLSTRRGGTGGAIVNISSLAAVAYAPGLTAYKLSKIGMNMLGQQLALGNAKYGIRVNTIMPGLMDTPMAIEGHARARNIPKAELRAERDKRVPLRAKMGTAWDVAYAALFLHSDESAFITGIALPVDGGQSARIG